MRITLVCNPASGAGPDPEALAGRLREDGHEVTVLPIDAVDRAGAGGPERIVVAGGDGSLGPAAAQAAAAGASLAVIPAGTANDFARALGIPGDEDEALALAADPAARTRPVDVARADGRPFLNAASFGLAVAAGQAAAPLKGALGPLAYAAGALKAGATEEAPHVRVTVDGAPLHDGGAWQVVVAGTGAFGGGSHLDPAEPADGLLDVAVVAEGPRAGLVRRAAGMRRGTLTGQDGVAHARGRVVEVALVPGAGPEGANVDGELVEPAPRRLQAGEERVEVVVP